MSSVKTDIRTGLPVDLATAQEERRRQELARDMETAADRGISQTHHAQRLRELIFDQMTARINELLQHDETISAMQTLLRRLELAEVKAEEAARRVMAFKSR
jgi:1,4-alpha-glucan branching enzyme